MRVASVRLFSMTAKPFTLHVWPGRWDIQSIDAGCLEAILFLQLAFPGLYSLVETADPDLSPTGQLPFLTHGQIVVSQLQSIISYLSAIDPSSLGEATTVNPNLDVGLNNLQLSQKPAWRAYIEAWLGDLVAHSFFVLEPNPAFTYGTLASMLSVPQRYYVPRRIRESYRPRLEAVGLWQIGNGPEGQGMKQKGGNNKETIRRAFGHTKLVEKATLVFDILSNLLANRSFIFTDRPTSLDLVLASRILLLVHAPLPNSTLKDLLMASYPSLLSHATHLHAHAFSPSGPHPQIVASPRANPLTILKSTVAHVMRSPTDAIDESEEAKQFRRYRWSWIVLTVAGAIGFIATQGLPIVVKIKRPSRKDEEEEEEELDVTDELGQEDEVET
ncbi:hypothetical protein K439DRAFT_823305 [Ramaria rubella]|nr:hypothetical protein K439DRAFT_823305 [Ramaria rubella]